MNLKRYSFLVAAVLAAGVAFMMNHSPRLDAEGPAGQVMPPKPAAPELSDAAMKALPTKGEQYSYAMGYDLGKSLKDLPTDIDKKQFMQALDLAMSGKDGVLSEQEVNGLKMAFIRENQAAQMEKLKAQGEENKKIGAEHLAKNKKVSGVKETESGLQYKVITAGKGKTPEKTDRVKVHYRGTTLDGQEFDSSYKRNQPAEFALNQVIPGWTEGLQLMTVGSKYELTIPAELAYGERGQGPKIPPNSVLVFEVELLDILPAPEKAEKKG